MSRKSVCSALAMLLVLSGLLLVAGPRPAAAEELADRVAKLEAQVEKQTKGPGIAIGDWRFLPYGYIKVDAVYDDSRVYNGDFLAWVLQEVPLRTNVLSYTSQANKNQHEFSLTANQTRLDLKVIAPKYGNWESYGLFEIDFYGQLTNNTLGTFDNKPAILVRHAFIELRNGTWGILAGQTSDPISLQVEDTWNYFVGWMAGNPGYRRPQIRVIKDIPLPDGSKVSAWIGAMRTLEATGLPTGGEEAGFPTGFARLAYTRPFLGKELLLAVDGHFGRERADNLSGTTAETALERNVKSYSGNVEFIVPLPVGFWLKGEAYYGETMGSYFGGIGQSISIMNTITGLAASPNDILGVRVAGGWAQLGWVAIPDKLRFHVGGSVDDVLKSTIPGQSGFTAVGGRSLNRQFYGNFMYNITPAITTGYEIMHDMTQYKNGPNGLDLRHQVSMMYKF